MRKFLLDQNFIEIHTPKLIAAASESGSEAVSYTHLICLTYSIDDFMISYFNCGTVETLPIACLLYTSRCV